MRPHLRLARSKKKKKKLARVDAADGWHGHSKVYSLVVHSGNAAEMMGNDELESKMLKRVRLGDAQRRSK